MCLPGGWTEPARPDAHASASYPLEPAHIGRGGSVTDSDLLVLAPWVLFAGGVVTLMVLAITRERRRSRIIRGRRGRRKDH
jgi:hypothetical protein